MKMQQSQTSALKRIVPESESKKRIIKWVLSRWQLYVLLSPAVIYMIIFQYYPMYGVQIAFKNYIVTKGILDSPWVGFQHFVRFFNSYDFWNVIKNTIGLNLYQLLAGFPFPIMLALSLNYVHNKYFKKTVQMVSYAPHFISVVVMVGMIMQFLDPRMGLMAQFADLLGFSPKNILSDPNWFKSIYVWSGIWQSLGFSCIIYIAALSVVDITQYEAAIMDGATKLQRMWYIDIPAILPVAVILLILNTGQMLNTGFEKVYLMQNPLNLRASEVIDTYVYKIGIVSQTSNFSYATAIGLFKSVISLTLLISVNKIARKLGQESLW